jgi:hypothetical protein
MGKTNLVAVAILATGLIWCVDRAAMTRVDAAGADCACQAVSVSGTVGEDGVVSLELPPEAGPGPLPLVSVYQRDSVWRPAEYDVSHGRTITVYGEPGTDVIVVALQTR